MVRPASAPFNCVRRTIDVSGDGTNNDGHDVAELRDQAVAKGATINGLVILSENPMPRGIRNTPIRPAASTTITATMLSAVRDRVMVAKDFNSFGRAIITKMIAEVSQAHDTGPWQAAVR